MIKEKQEAAELNYSCVLKNEFTCVDWDKDWNKPRPHLNLLTRHLNLQKDRLTSLCIYVHLSLVLALVVSMLRCDWI